MTRRFGKFYLSDRRIVDRDIRAIMGLCVILRCEHSFFMNGFNYEAMSPLFEEVPEGETMPEYTWTITACEPLGQRSYSAHRVA